MLTKVIFRSNEQESQHELEIGSSIGTFLRDQGILPQFCGGNGTCGKCKIKANTKATKEEIHLLNTSLINANIRLACYTKVVEGLEIESLEQDKLIVETNFLDTDYAFAPLLEYKEAILPPKTLDDQRDDLTRVMQTFSCTSHSLNLKELSELAQAIDSNTYFKVLYRDDNLIGLSFEEKNLALAIDIGTTSIAGNLIDLDTKKILATDGVLNLQSSWGADIISRINHTIPEVTNQYKENITKLQKSVVMQLDTLVYNLLVKAGLSPQTNIHYMTIAGNTTMLHMLTALPAKNISRAPFTPVVNRALHVRSSEIGMQTKSHLFLMPCISGYVGADITAAMLAIDIHKTVAHKLEKPFLLLDLGTNAEIVLGYKGKFYVCSAAAGPCFEGAKISCGMMGKSGAIDKAGLNADGTDFYYTTINNTPAEGVCGSGMLDIVALLLDSKTLEDTGYISEEETTLSSYIVEDEEGRKSFKITENIYFTQRDIREIQLAKAAIRAGIQALLLKAEVDISEVEIFYIAGGFGNALSPSSAIRIGLIPQEMQGRTKAVGNAASYGAIRYATQKDAHEIIENFVCNSTYIELSTLTNFTELYVDYMEFPHFD